ncbi:MAG: alternative ribosome rescue aminoacyl-tRNA hydrolase ArfB [Cyclobacteriaceae bacterium]|nr:alternative ribosome rescue aminoacyl-tRNA hydrolase ArfB [Cyclobacteriaceae bacterium]
MLHQSRPQFHNLKREIKVKTSRSGGPGGQHVNKVESKVQVIFNIPESAFLTPEQKEQLLAKYASKISKEGDLTVTCEAHRSQIKNKEQAFKKMDRLIGKAFEMKKARKKTGPTRASKEKRLKGKKLLSEKKKMRGGGSSFED